MKELRASKEFEIRFSEVDSMSFVWNGSYPLYFEDAREAFGKKYGLGYLFIFDNGFYASPVAVGGKIIAANLDGDLLLLSATREKLTVEAKYSMKTKLFAVPALSGGNVIVRTGANELVCLEAEP